MSHDTVLMRPPGAPKGVTIPIDVGISKLIKALWQADIHTVNSCQDRAAESEPKPGIAWIQFASSTDFESFLDVTQGDGIDHEDWQIDYLLEDVSTADDPGMDHRVFVSVRYPFEQTDELAARVRGFARFLKEQETASAVMH